MGNKGGKERSSTRYPLVNNIQHPLVSGNHAPVVGKQGKMAADALGFHRRGEGRFVGLGESVKVAV